MFGGYSNDGRWVRDLGLHRSIVSNDAGTTGIRAVVADGIIGSRTVFDGFDVLSGNNPNPGGSSYAIWVRGSDDQLVLRNLNAIGGQGGPGTDGAAGTVGSDGNTGDPGGKGNTDNGCNDASQNAGFGGAGGASSGTSGRDARGGKGGLNILSGRRSSEERSVEDGGTSRSSPDH